MARTSKITATIRPPAGANRAAEPGATVLGLYVISGNGLAAVRVELPGLSPDPTLLGMMLGAVADMLRETIGAGRVDGEARILRVAVGRRGFLLLPAKHFGLLVVYEGRETDSFVDRLGRFARRIEGMCGEALRDWDGNRAPLAAAEALARSFVETRQAGLGDATDRRILAALQVFPRPPAAHPA